MQSNLKYNPKSEVVKSLPNRRDAKENTVYYLIDGTILRPRILVNGKWYKQETDGTNVYYTEV